MMKLAFLFPGQGSQAVGMARDLVAGNETARRMFAEASTVVGYDIAQLCADGPAERLNMTLYTQPALYTMSCVLAELARQRGLVPAVVAGHSVGEYAALYVAGVYSFSVGARIVAERAQLMHTAGGGKMLAVVGMEPDTVESVLSAFSRDRVGIGLYNSPSQLVVSGCAAGVDEAEAALRAAGGKKLVPLAVSGAFHSEQMRPVRDAFAEALSRYPWRDPAVPYVSNLTGDVVESADAVRQGLAELLVSPVRWMQSMQRLAAMGVSCCIELGPGKVLQGLARQTVKDLPCVGAATLEQLEQLAKELKSQV